MPPVTSFKPKHVNQDAQIEFWRGHPVQAALDIFGATDPDFDLSMPQRHILESRWRHSYELDILGRGNGKCIALDSLVLTSRGMMTMTDMAPDKRPAIGDASPCSFTVHNGSHVVDATHWYDDGVQDGWTIENDATPSTSGTHQHKVLVWRDGHEVECRLDEVAVGDHLIVPRGQMIFGSDTRLTFSPRPYAGGRPASDVNIPTHLNPDLAYMLGLLVGDGTCGYENWIGLSSADRELLDVFSNTCQELFGIRPSEDKDKRSACFDSRLSSAHVRDFLDQIGLGRHKAEFKTVPQCILRGPEWGWRAFLRGLFDTDGSAEAGYVSYCSSSRKLIDQVQVALLNLGILSFRRQRTDRAWEIYIGSDALRTFERVVGFGLQRKRIRLVRLCQKPVNPNRDVVPGVANLLDALTTDAHRCRIVLSRRLGDLRRKLNSYRTQACQPSYASLQKILDKLPELSGTAAYNQLAKLCRERPFFSRVTAKHVYRGHVADLVVPDGNLFCANGIVQHNTWINALHAWLLAILYPGQRIGLIAPSFRQAKLMFTELENLYRISPLIQECVEHGPVVAPEKCHVRLKAAPYKIGSVIEALPMGVDGNKIRGARYYVVLADELAQIDADTLDIVVGGFLATAQNPMKRAKMFLRLEKELALGLISEEEMKRQMGGGNKFYGTSTAFYQYNHLWERQSQLIQDIYHTKQMLIRKGEPHEHLVVKGGPLHDGMIPARYLSDGKSAMCVHPYWDMDKGMLDMESVERQQRIMSNYQFRMEYECFSPPDSEGFFRRSLLEAARQHNSFSATMRPRPGLINVMGIDPGRVSDNFAASMFEVDLQSRLCRLARIWTWNNKPIPEVHREVRDLIRQFNIQKIKLDSGGGGREFRDLLADPHSCPAGQRLILEKDNPEHGSKTGDFLVAPLVEFSNYEWLQGANEGMRSALEHGRMLVAAEGPVPGEVWEPAMDFAGDELEKAISEISSIITTARGNRLHWDTPQKNQKKDRYTATLLGYDAARQYIDDIENPDELAEGFFA